MTDPTWTARLVTLPHECLTPPKCVRCARPAPDGVSLQDAGFACVGGWRGVLCVRCATHYADTPICDSCGGDHSDMAHYESPEIGQLG